MIWRVEHSREIDSTNDWLAQRARDSAPEGLVALSDFQSAGRGRLDRAWEAPARSALLCSFLFRPTFDIEQLQLVVAAVALAARASLVRLCGLRPDLKWPNDLMVGDTKLAGLLAEVIDTDHGRAVVVGLGLNLTNHPYPVASTSVLEATGITLSARGLLDIVLEELEWRYRQMDSEEGRDGLHREYQRSLATLGQRVRVERTRDVLEGEARAVDQFGRLIVVVDGHDVVFSSGDVVHLRPQLGASA
jgi:BirA family biotin operon repressor/biotin-[acetyl-CoA-carboxylase] ligase